MKTVFIALFYGLVATAAMPAFGQTSVVLRPGQVHEDCQALKTGETLRWQFVATGPVDFNVHYHTAETVETPLQRAAVQDAAGVFTAPSAQEFCWMWTNRATRDVVLRAKLER